jgi:hypothetical protein
MLRPKDSLTEMELNKQKGEPIMKSTKLITRLAALSMSILLAGTSPAVHTANVGPSEEPRHGESMASRPKHNLTGPWTWRETTESAIPPFIVEMIGQGIVPEGEITYLSCVAGGEMELVQTGKKTFAGRATQAGSCMTEGGQGPFWPPSFPPLLEITNGVISGKYLSFTFGSCNFTAKVTGSGDKLKGQGTCPIPLPPPYFLINPAWKARRR